MSSLRRLRPTRHERDMLRRVVQGYRRAGLRCPALRLVVVERHPSCDGWATSSTIYVERRALTVELLVHEVAHVIADRVAVHPRAAAHNRLWAVIYGIGYQQCIER